MIITRDMILAGAPVVTNPVLLVKGDPRDPKALSRSMRDLLEEAADQLDRLGRETLVPDQLARVLAASWHDNRDIQFDDEVFSKAQLFDMVTHPEQAGKRVLFYKEMRDNYRPQLVVYG